MGEGIIFFCPSVCLVFSIFFNISFFSSFLSFLSYFLSFFLSFSTFFSRFFSFFNLPFSLFFSFFSSLTIIMNTTEAQDSNPVHLSRSRSRRKRKTYICVRIVIYEVNKRIRIICYRGECYGRKNIYIGIGKERKDWKREIL